MGNTASQLDDSDARLFELPALPGAPIGKHLRLIDVGERRIVLCGTAAVHTFERADRAGESLCVAMLSVAGVASDVEIGAAFGMHRNTVARHARRLAEGGVAAVVPAKRGPKGPSKTTPKVLALIDRHAGEMNATELRDLIGERIGVVLSASHVGNLAAAARRLSQPALAPPIEGDDATEGDDDDRALEGDREAAEDHDDVGVVEDVGGGDDGDDLAFDPPVSLPRTVRGRYMGLALYYPALAAVGLVEVAREVFRLPRSERFGVRATTLCLFFMTILSKTTLEAAKHLRRIEFGAVVGSGRAPCVKTLRRKLAELACQGGAGELGVRLARRWVEGAIVATAYLYVDGHMKAYTGKRRLAEVWNSQRRMPLPGIHTYFVNDGDGRPLLFLTEALSTNLAKALPRIIEAIREVLGERAFTVIFDRGGYDGKLFAWLAANDVSFITYQRGTPSVPAERFVRRETRFEGRRVRFSLAEDAVKVGGTGPWRRIVMRTTDGHQTPILTNLGHGVGSARITCLMFARWRQENLFKYMGQHHGLDQLVSYGAEAADPDSLMPNPQRRHLDSEIAELRRQASKLKADLGEALLDEPKARSRSAHGLKIAQGGAVARLRALEDEITKLIAVRKALPARVPVGDSGKVCEVMRLEHKAIVDRVKISAYNAEEWMLDRLIGHYPNPHDVRDLLRSFAELSGQIRTTDAGVVVTLDPPDTPIHRRALRGLVGDLNAVGATFPGTDRSVTYRVAMHHSEAAA